MVNWTQSALMMAIMGAAATHKSHDVHVHFCAHVGWLEIDAMPRDFDYINRTQKPDHSVTIRLDDGDAINQLELALKAIQALGGDDDR